MTTPAPTPVSDFGSNTNDNIASAADVLGRSKDRTAVFKEIHRGRKQTKTATEIANAAGLNRKRVVEEAVKLVHKGIIKKTKRDDEIAYTRIGFYYQHRNTILRLATNPKKRKTYATKYNQGATAGRVTLSIPKRQVRTATLTIDGIDSFARVRKVRSGASVGDMRESKFKQGIKRVLGETGRFKDWGGETSDLFTTRLRLGGKRHAAAMAFKGRATRGILTPARLGKNGDQIQRLFFEDADVFLIQYGGQIASTVVQQMATYAQSKSLSTGKKIHYGTIDGNDSARLVSAYRNSFR